MESCLPTSDVVLLLSSGIRVGRFALFVVRSRIRTGLYRLC